MGVTMVRGWVLVACVVAVSACKKTPPRASFNEAATKAAQSGDRKALWNLLDDASRKRILAGTTRLHARAKAHADTEALLKAVLGSELPATPEELALAMLPLVELKDDGTTAAIHVEGGAWRASVEPVGFIDGDGIPRTLTLLRLANESTLPAPPPPARSKMVAINEMPDEKVETLWLTWRMKDKQGRDLDTLPEDERMLAMIGKDMEKDVLVGFKVNLPPPGGGQTLEELFRPQLVRATELTKLPDAYVAHAVTILVHYLKDKAIDIDAAIDVDGTLSPRYTVYDDQFMVKVERKPGPLTFRAWP